MFVLDDSTLALMRERWLSITHVGAARPFVKGWVRTAKLRRGFEHVSADEVYAHVPGWEGTHTIYKGTWVPHGPYIELPNIQSVEGAQDFEQKGLQNVTITMDNIGVTERTGVAGIYHAIERGYYAPFRGFRPPARTAVGTENEWFDKLNDKSTEVVIVAGYGPDAAICMFKGLVDEDSLTSRPDIITVTARDMGQYLTDQPVFLVAKVRSVPDPITFADRRGADKTRSIQSGCQASSHEPGRNPRFAADGRTGTFWESEGHDHSHGLEWIEMSIPAGRYESIRLHPQYKDLECYIAVLARDKNAPGGKGARKRFIEPLPDNEWVDEGHGVVPGTTTPYVARISNVKAKERTYFLSDYGYVLGDDSKVRLYFTNLSHTFNGHDKAKHFRAGVQEFAAIRRRLPHDVKRYKWILVDDVADIVRTVLQWVGLTDWEVEDTGVRLTDRGNLVYNRGNYLMDIIDHIAEMTNYVFFLKPPEVFDDEDLSKENPNNLSMGVAVFRNNHAMRLPRQTIDPIEAVREDTTLSGIEPNFSNDPLAYNIRVRGKRLKKKNGGRIGGGEDRTHRYMYVYRPPWSRNADFPGDSDPKDFQQANIKRYEVAHNYRLASFEECKVEALFIAFRMALEAYKATIQFPCFPAIQLDNQTAVRDTGTGLSTRLWTATRNWSIRTGEDGEFKMALGGSLLDVPDIIDVREELVRVLADANRLPGLSQWERDNFPRPRD